MTAVTQARVAASEWTKLHSLRSSRITMLVALGLVVGLGVLVPWLSVTDWQPGTSTEGYPAVERSLGGIYLAQLAFGVLGAMAVTGEYATGTIRATLAAVPKRLPVLWAKCGVFVAVTLVLGTIACVLAFVGGQAIFASKDVDASFSDPHVARAVFGSGLFLTGMGAFGLALGALVRNTAAAITTLTLRAVRGARDRRPAPVGGHDRPVPAGHRGAVDHVRRAVASSGRGRASACCAPTLWSRWERPPSC